jgi:hypothetical protein
MGRHSAKNASLVGAKSQIGARALASYDQHDAMADGMVMMQKTLELGVGLSLPHPMEVDPGLGIGSARKLSKCALLQGNQGFNLAAGRLRRSGLHWAGRRRNSGIGDWRNGGCFAEQRPDMADDRTPKLKLMPGQAAP